MNKKTFFYVTDMHGASILETGEALKGFENINIKKFQDNSENSKKFIKICNKLMPNLGVMRIVAKLSEERAITSVKIKIYPVLGRNSIWTDRITFIKQRVIDNHAIITQIEEKDVPTENSFEYKGVKYEFTIFEDELSTAK